MRMRDSLRACSVPNRKAEVPGREKPEAAAAEALRAAMAGRGKLIAVVGDEDTVTGFLLGGVGELNAQRKPNFLVVEKETSVAEIEETFRCGPHRGWGGG